jgi:alpha,alpha-trehalase
MHQTALGMIENMLDLVDRVGFVPNGGRVYYLHRSQPPFLTQMLMSYLNASQSSGVALNMTLLQRAAATLANEHRFWIEHRSVSIGQYTLARFHANSNVPRPEGFVEDIQTAINAGVDPHQPSELYRHIASGAESGWDFSTRYERERESKRAIERAHTRCRSFSVVLLVCAARTDRNLVEDGSRTTHQSVVSIQPILFRWI